MNRRRIRQVFFVCSALSADNQLISEAIPAPSIEEACVLFENKFQIKPLNILGPFYKKKKQILENTTNIVCSVEQKRAEYNGWIVIANILKIPEYHALLLFNKRIDGKNLPKPQGTIIVPIQDLRFI